MDRIATTIDTYNKCAEVYQNKAMSMDLYHSSYDRFCDRVKKNNPFLLEVACGPGNMTRYLLEKRPDFKIKGIDLAENMVSLARINVPEAEFMVMDCRDISSLTEKYDALVAGFCMPYLSKEECESFISDIASLLNTGGEIYLSTMEGEDTRAGFETTSFSGDDLIFLYYHQRDHLITTLEKNGFTGIELITEDYPEPDGSFTTDMIFLATKS